MLNRTVKMLLVDTQKAQDVRFETKSTVVGGGENGINRVETFARTGLASRATREFSNGFRPFDGRLIAENMAKDAITCISAGFKRGHNGTGKLRGLIGAARF